MIIMPFDVFHIYRLGNAGQLIEFPEIIREIGIVSDAAQVAFEMRKVYGVEPNEGREKA